MKESNLLTIRQNPQESITKDLEVNLKCMYCNNMQLDTFDNSLEPPWHYSCQIVGTLSAPRSYDQQAPPRRCIIETQR